MIAGKCGRSRWGKASDDRPVGPFGEENHSVLRGEVAKEKEEMKKEAKKERPVQKKNIGYGSI